MSSFPGLLRKPGNEAATAATGILYHCMLYGLFEVVCSLLGGGALDLFFLLSPCSISSWSRHREPGRYRLHTVALLLTQTALFCVASNLFVKFLIVTVHFYTSCILISVHHLYVLFLILPITSSHVHLRSVWYYWLCVCWVWRYWLCV